MQTEIIRLQQQVMLLSNRAEEMEAERDNAHHNTQIWQRRVEEQQDILDQRDKAITNLVRQNLQAAKTQQDGMKIGELKRLHQQENDKTVRWHQSMLKTKDDKINELERQVSRLRVYDSHLSTAQSSQVSNLVKEVKRLRDALNSKEQECAQVNERVKKLDLECREAKLQLKEDVAERQSKMKALSRDNEAQSAQLRELKRQLWKAKDSSGEIQDLKQDLAKAQRQIRTLEAEKRATIATTRRQVEETVRSELRAAQETHRLLEERLVQMEAAQKSISPSSSSSVASSGQDEATVTQLKEKAQHLTNQLESKSNLLRICQTKIQALEFELRNTETRYTDSGSDCPSLDGPQISDSMSKKVRFHNSELHELRFSLDKAEKDMCTIDEIASTQLDILADRLKSNMAFSDEAQGKIRELESSLKEARSREKDMQNKLDKALKERSIQGNLDEAQKAREASEHSIVRTFERQISQKDSLIDDLRNDLAAMRTKRAEEVTDLNRELTALRSELESIHNEYDVKLKGKDQHIFALEHTLHAQEQTLDNMRTEMDQLQSGMQGAAANRRGEVEGLEQEVMTLRAEISKQEKQVTNLRMQLKEEELGHKAEILRLEEVIAEFESEMPKFKARASIESTQRIKMVKGRLDQLKLKNQQLKEENIQLGERLEKGIIKIHALEAKIGEAEDIKIEYEILRRQVKELQSSLDQLQNVTDVSSLPEEEVAAHSSDKEGTRPRRKNQIPRLFKRRKPSAASNAVLVPDQDEAGPPLKTISTGRAGGAMYF